MAKPHSEVLPVHNHCYLFLHLEQFSLGYQNAIERLTETNHPHGLGERYAAATSHSLPVDPTLSVSIPQHRKSLENSFIIVIVVWIMMNNMIVKIGK